MSRWLEFLGSCFLYTTRLWSVLFNVKRHLGRGSLLRSAVSLCSSRSCVTELRNQTAGSCKTGGLGDLRLQVVNGISLCAFWCILYSNSCQEDAWVGLLVMFSWSQWLLGFPSATGVFNLRANLRLCDCVMTRHWHWSLFNMADHISHVFRQNGRKHRVGLHVLVDDEGDTSGGSAHQLS